MNTPKLIAIFLAVFAITSHAETAAQLKQTIESFSNGTGTLSAAININGNTVTVTGTKTGTNEPLNLLIDGGVSVIWKANLTGSTAGDMSLIYKGGYGLFEVQDGGKVTQTGTAPAITNGNDWMTGAEGSITISGGTVSATNCAIYSYASGTVTISGGTVSATTGSAVCSYAFGTVTISGGTVSATTGSAVCSYDGTITVSGTTTKVTSANTTSGTIMIESSGAMTERLVITGGTVENTANNANARTVYNNSNQTVIISGGTVSATASGGAVHNNAGTIILIGGTVTGGTKYYNSISNGTIIEWTKTAPQTYRAFASTDLTLTPTNASAVWKNKYGIAGIAYANGFVAVSGVTVSKVSIPPPTITNAPFIYTGSEQTATIAANELYTITGDKETNAGSHTATVALKDKENYEWNNSNPATDLSLPWTIDKADDLENTAPPNRQISASNTQTHTYDLNTLAFNNGDHGALSFQLGAFTGNTDILTAKPSIGSDGHTLSYTGTGKTSGEATLEITVTSVNYTDITTTITFEATPKTEVAITNITIQNYVYDGTPKSGYTGTPASGAYTGTLLYQYAGTGIDGITTDKPKNAGEYTLKISLPPEAPYVGVWSDDFTIAKATAATPTGLTATVGQTLANVALPTGWAWQNLAASVGAVGVQKHKANYTPSDAVNYNTLTGIEVSIQVNAANPILQQIATGSIRVQATTNAIMLENLPKNTKVQIYSLQGKQIYSTNSENSQILRIPVQTKGMYIVKAGNQTLRVAVK
jgi:hypothetical protein